MKRVILLIFILLLLPVAYTLAFSIPEPTLTRTHLYRDIEESTTTFGLGFELFQMEPEPPYVGELYYGYYGEAITDWFEIGAAIHSVFLIPSPFAELKLDLIDLFADDSRLSFLAMGGLGVLIGDQVAALPYHGGVALSFHVNQRIQLYAGIGSDSISQKINLQAGGYTRIVDWLGVSANLKLVTGNEGTQPMLSIAPLFIKGK